MTDTGWTFGGFRVIESEYAPDLNRIKHLGTPPSDYSPFLSRIINTCDLHGAILDVSDPVQNMRTEYDYHTRRSVNTSKERTMTTDHIDQLAQWYADAEQVTKTNLPNKGDTLIYPCRTSGYIIESDGGGWTPELVRSTGETVRILARAPKPKPAWHAARAVIATADDEDGDAFTGTWIPEAGDRWLSDEGHVVSGDDLRDVTPLIEAKVTDEMVARVSDVLRDAYGTYDNGYTATEVVTAALGLDTE